MLAIAVSISMTLQSAQANLVCASSLHTIILLHIVVFDHPSDVFTRIYVVYVCREKGDGERVR